MELGKYNTLRAARYTSVGLFLEDEQEESVLLPMKWVPKDITEGDELEVFVYLDSEERPIATTMTPKAIVGEFAFLEVKQMTHSGAFLDWGLQKDLFVPFIEQDGRMQPGEWHTVYLYIDPLTERITATARIERKVEKEAKDLSHNQEVDLLIASKTPLGFNVIIDQRYMGLVYENEVFQNIKPGDKVKGFIKQIREDGKIDVSLQKQGFSNVEPNAAIILEKLKENEGFLPLSDKSDPDDIKHHLEMSKKTFKKAIGGLYKQKLISIEPDGIKLV